MKLLTLAMRIPKFTFLLIFISTLPLSAQQFNINQGLSGGFPNDAALIDVDGDNDLDIIRVVSQYSGTDNMNASEVWKNDGAGNFTLFSTFGDTQSSGVATGDFDNDGDIDVFIACNTSGSLTLSANKVWLNDGNGNFTDSGQLLGYNPSLAVTVADFDGDGDLDAFVANSSSSSTASRANKVWINDGSGQFTNSGQSLGNSNTGDLACGDVDNDGDMDVVTANFSENLGNVVWLNDGTGNFSTSTPALGNNRSHGVALEDMNGDSHLDLIFANRTNPSNQYINDGSGNFSLNGSITLSTATNDVVAADFDNDGDNDFILGVFNETDTNKLYVNNGSGQYTEGFKFINDDYTLRLAPGDLDNDGDIDLFSVNVNNVSNKIWLNDNNDDLSIPNFQNETIVVYPNPTNGILNIQGKSPILVNVYNSMGQLMNTSSIAKKHLIDLEKKSSGVYIIELVGEDFNETKRVIVR